VKDLKKTDEALRENLEAQLQQAQKVEVLLPVVEAEIE